MRLEKVLGIPVGAETVFMTMTMLMLTCMLVAGTGVCSSMSELVFV